MIEDSLGYLGDRVARSMAHQLAEELRPAGVGIGQWAVLMFLWARDGVSQAELSRVVAIGPPTMVRTIDRMVRDGFVGRVPHPGDGRISRIFLTSGASADCTEPVWLPYSWRPALLPLTAFVLMPMLASLGLTVFEWNLLHTPLRGKGFSR
ncbi:MAG: MarR family winged helix-turn-helix transcriptional regulator [Candidatus Limnocylindria bacterium]